MTCKCSLVFAACLAFCTVQAQPMSQAPVLADAPHEVLFRPQKPLELACTVRGDASQVTYEWRKDGQVVKSGPQIKLRGNKLLIKEPKDADAGEYQCLAKTPAGVAITRRIAVNKAYLTAPKVTTEKTKPVEGKPLSLSCKTPAFPYAYPKPTIQWKKQSNDGKSVDVLDGRITIGGDGNLYFTNVTEQDISKDFKYVCVAKSPAVNGEVPFAEYIIEGLEKNPNPDHEAEQLYVTHDQFTLEAGKQAYLYCIYGSSPQAYPDWFKNGVNVNNKPEDRVTRYNRSKGKRLLIKQVLPEDEGDYSCVINNELGKEQKYTFHVNVISAPIFVKKPEKRVQAKAGSDVFLPCEVQAIPAGSSEWTYNAQPLKEARATSSAKGLTISKVQKSDSGYYGCHATNEHGDNYTETLLQVA